VSGLAVPSRPVPGTILILDHLALVQLLKASPNRWRSRQRSKKELQEKDKEMRELYARMREDDKKMQLPSYEVLFQAGRGDKFRERRLEIRTQQSTAGSMEDAR